MAGLDTGNNEEPQTLFEHDRMLMRAHSTLNDIRKTLTVLQNLPVESPCSPVHIEATVKKQLNLLRCITEIMAY
ncbi:MULTISPECIES: hypothetical protein [Legionella]|uniref:hypothetical protein n=1 Tax=Legionella TaxID=445 RepID=UPI001041A26F|nr:MULTISPECIES: hypothetical protein [Legionella]